MSDNFTFAQWIQSEFHPNTHSLLGIICFWLFSTHCYGIYVPIQQIFSSTGCMSVCLFCIFTLCHVSSIPAYLACPSDTHCSLRSILPFVHLTPWPAIPKRRPADKIIFYVSVPQPPSLTCCSLLFSLPPFFHTATFLLPLPFLCFVGDWFQSCSLTDLMSGCAGATRSRWGRTEREWQIERERKVGWGKRSPKLL